MQMFYLGRAPRTKETLPDFLKWHRVTRHPLVFHGLTGSQRTPGFGASHFYFINNPPINSIASQVRIWTIIHMSNLLSQNKRFILVKSTSVVYLYNVIFRMNPCPNIQCWIKPFTLEQYCSLDWPARIFQLYNFLKLTIVVDGLLVSV